MTIDAPVTREHGNAYNIFILVVTLFSLAIMGVLLLPLDDDTRTLLNLYDNAICVIFLLDFAYNLTGSRPRTEYFIRQRGWLDLLGSIPTLGLVQFAALLRLARLSRLARIGRLLSGKNRRALVSDVVQNRGQYATFITILAAGIVLSVASVLVLQFESVDDGANIQTAGDAIWWGVVTITTVGYGDRFPVTLLGRLTGLLVMLAGIGIIGALASILASILVPPAKDEGAAPQVDGAAAGGTAATPLAPPDAMASILAELAALRAEVSELRAALTPERPA